jgi:hypothetical protein
MWAVAEFRNREKGGCGIMQGSEMERKAEVACGRVKK